MRKVLGRNRRFELLSKLGTGGTGTVYEAHDRERDERVALKTLHDPSAAALVRFRREFRILQDLHHPNLVNLGELMVEQGTWFFTMELVRGLSFLKFVQPDDSPDARCDLERLRHALAEVTRGLLVLHDAGLVHRDIKPSNVLMRADGRGIILDFGFATSDDDVVSLTKRNHVVGTIAYMAPEQAAGRRASPAADWYGVGAMLYEALVGRVPFEGSAMQVLLEKQRREATPARALQPNVDLPLDALCCELLRLDPALRPGGAHILARLGLAPDNDTGAALRVSTFTSAESFVGRSAELTHMTRAFERCLEGGARALVVRGESGLGKSALARHFADALVQQGRALVLRGRCYEREAVRYKALDGLFESLVRHLQSQPADEVRRLLPEHARSLADAFPVLHQLPAFASGLQHGPRVADPQESRSRLFSAARELFSRLAERAPLVLVIDDLQWSDVDSLALLAEILRGPDARRILLLGTARPTPESDSTHAELLRLPCELQEMELEPLGHTDGVALAQRMLERAHPGSASLAHTLAEEANGHPLFIAELARELAMQTSDVRAPMARTRLEDVLWRRIERLDAPARRILEHVAVAGAPLPASCIAHAAGVAGADFSRGVAALRVGQLLRTLTVRHADALDTYHDRVREIVLARLSDVERKAGHLRIACELEAVQADPEPIAMHLCEADELARAADYSVRAAERASLSLAFDRAATLYGQAAQLLGRLGKDAHTLHALQAAALAHAGRGAEAARLALQTAAQTTGAEAMELRRRAAQQFLLAGHLDDGVAALRSVLADEDMSLPESRARTILFILWDRLRLRLRGLGSTPRDESQVSARDLARIDVCWHAGNAFIMVDRIKGAAFHGRSLQLALDAGEPARIARSLALQATIVATDGAAAIAGVQPMLARAEELASAVRDPYPMAIVRVARGILSLMAGRFRPCAVELREADRILREACVGTHWERATVDLYYARALQYLGEFAELSRWLPSVVQNSRDRGDLYGATTLSVSIMPVIWLSRGESQRAREDVQEALRQWSPREFHIQHYHALVSRAAIALYRGELELAQQELLQSWPALERSWLLRTQIIRATLCDLKGRTLLALAARDEARRTTLLQEVEQHAHALEREGLTWLAAFAATLRAGVAHVRGQPEETMAWLRRAARRFDRAEMSLHAACVRRRVGMLSGGTEGLATRASAENWMRGQGIAELERMAALLTPGFEDT